MRLMLLLSVAVLCIGCGGASPRNKDRVARALDKIPSTGQATAAVARREADSSRTASEGDGESLNRQIIYTAVRWKTMTAF